MKEKSGVVTTRSLAIISIQKSQLIARQRWLFKYTIIVNSSPLGTYPDINEKPMIPYQFLTQKHLLYDLIYNPVETAFLLEGKKRGAQVKNGLEMLELQAEESWRLWNK